MGFMPPSISVVSCREIAKHVGWRPVYEFEDILVETSNATLLTAVEKPKLPRGLRGIRRRISGHYLLSSPPPASDILLIVCLIPSNLELLRAVQPWRKNFKKIVAFVCDSFATGLYPKITSEYDHIFVPIPESVHFIRKTFGTKVSVLPFAADCVRYSNYQGGRSIDLISIGRCPSDVKTAFRNRFHNAEFPFLFLHSPIGNLWGDDIWRERDMLMKLYQRARLALAYDIMIEPDASRPISMPIVLPRYFETLAAGCVIVGRRPSTPFAEEMFPWEDAMIELPEDPKHAVESVVSLLSQGERLKAARHRNICEMKKRHDWRHRVSQLLAEIG